MAGDGQWYFMSDLRKMKAGVDDPNAWTKYDAKMNKQLETAYGKGFKQYTMTFKDKQYIVKHLCSIWWFPDIFVGEETDLFAMPLRKKKPSALLFECH